MRRSKFKAMLLAAAVAACTPPWESVQIALDVGARRSCTGEVRVTLVEGADAQGAQPVIESMTQIFRSERVAGGYAFVQDGATSMGPINLRATVSENGAVTEASISGAGLGPVFSGSAEDMNRLAMAGAKSIPERMVLGRSFRVGDEYYTQDMVDELVSAMTRSMGLPDSFEMNVNARAVKFAGITDENGARAYTFAGTMHLTGGASQDGQTFAIDYPTETQVSYDPETGLLRSTSTDGVITTTVNGQRQGAMRMQQTLTCTISRG